MKISSYKDRYITVKKQGTELMGMYTGRCKREKLPIVYARGTGKKYRFVEMDLIYVQGSHSYTENKAFRDEMVKAIEQATGKKYTYWILPGLYTTVRRIPVENAERLMLDFLAIYERHQQPEGNVQKKITLKDIMSSTDWPRCEHCRIRPQALTVTHETTKNEIPSYGLPPWCTVCLDDVEWEVYWLCRAKEDYVTGKRQS